jgi:hypothetical protein
MIAPAASEQRTHTAMTIATVAMGGKYYPKRSAAQES